MRPSARFLELCTCHIPGVTRWLCDLGTVWFGVEHSLLWWMSLYILTYYFYHLICLCSDFIYLSALICCCSSVFIRRIIDNFFKNVSFWLDNVFSKYEDCDPVNWFNNTSWDVAITPTNRHKSVRNRCVFNIFWRFFVVTVLFGSFCCKVSCNRTESDLFLILFISYLIWVSEYTDKPTVLLFPLFIAQQQSVL